MDEDTCELVRQLFAQVTMILEDAHEVAVKGQASKLTVRSTDKYMRRLKVMALEVATLADAALVVGG